MKVIQRWVSAKTSIVVLSGWVGGLVGGWMSENVNGALTYILIEQRGNERQQTDGDNIANGGGQRRGQIVRIQAILLREQNHSDKHKVCNEYT